MQETNKHKVGRRKFLGTAATVAAGLSVGVPKLIGAPAILKYYNSPDSFVKGVQIGVITYSFRSMPEQSAEATLQYIVDSGISAVELMGGPAESFAGKPNSPVDRRAFFRLMRARRRGDELSDTQKAQIKEMEAQLYTYNQEVAAWRAKVPMDKFTEVKKMYAAAGVSIYGFKPNAFSITNTDAEIEYGFRAAKALGASHVTLEHPSDDAHTLKLGQMAKKHKMRVAYHGHEQQTPTFWDTALEQSKYNALNPDIGHYVAAGNQEPLGLLKANYKRISSMHLKDRQTPANGKGNLLWGTGDTPLVEALQLMRDQKYKFPATVELEYEIPEGSDAVKEVQKCLEYCQRALEA